MVEKVIAVNDEILEELEEVLRKKNEKKPMGEKLTIRILPEELALYQHYVNLTEYKNLSDLVRNAVREKIEKIIIPHNPVEERFIGIWGIYRKIGKAIGKEINESEIENRIEKIAEKVTLESDEQIDSEKLLELIKMQHINDAILTAIVQRKLYS